MRFFKYISVGILFISTSNFIKAQGEKELLLSTPQTTAGTYAARDKIKLSPGFNTKGSTGTERFVLDANIAPLATNNQLNNLGGSNYHGSPFHTSYFNTTFEIGSISGSAEVNLNGAATYTIPIDIPSGTLGMLPEVNMVYNSQAGEGLLGKGWEIAGMSFITYSPQTPSYIDENSNIVGKNYGYVLDGQRLISLKGAGNYGSTGAQYAFEMENYNRVEQFADYFILTTKEGKKLEYGHSADSKIFNNLIYDNRGKIFIWRLNKVTDQNGNYIKFTYGQEAGESWIQTIEYTGNDNAGLVPYNKIQFLYDSKRDPIDLYSSFSKISQSRILSKIIVSSSKTIYRVYDFNYSNEPNLDSKTFLTEIKESNAEGNSFNTTKINWGLNCSPNANPTIAVTNIPTNDRQVSGDLNGDGIKEIITIIDGNLSLGTVGKIVLYGTAGDYMGGVDYVTNSRSNTLVEQVTPIDLNADGKDELVVFEKFYDPYAYNPIYFVQFQYTLKVNVYSFDNGHFINVSSSFPRIACHFPLKTYEAKASLNNDFYNYRFGDFDGDKEVDAILVHTIYDNPNNLLIPRSELININVGDNRYAVYYGFRSFVYGYNIPFYYGFYPVNTNSDSKTEIIFAEKWQLVVSQQSTVSIFPVGSKTIPPPTGQSFDNLQIRIADFNNDGISDIICLKPTYSITKTNDAYNTFMDHVLGQNTMKSSDSQISIDGFWVAFGNGDTYNNWIDMYSLGGKIINGRLNTFGPLNQTTYHGLNSTFPDVGNLILAINKSTTSYFDFGDFVGDNKDELMVSTLYGENNLIFKFYSITENSLNLISSQVKDLKVAGLNCPIYNTFNFKASFFNVLDFNSDSKAEIFLKFPNCNGNKVITFTNDNCKNDLISSIENGFGNKTTFDYEYLNKSSFYTKSALPYDVSISLPMKIVTKLKQYAANNTVSDFSFNYKNLTLKNKGTRKGLLGFDQFIKTDNINGIKTTMYVSFPDNLLFSPFVYNTHITNLSDELISEQTFSQSNAMKDGRFITISNKSSKNKDYIHKTSSNSTTVYTLGNVTSQETTFYEGFFGAPSYSEKTVFQDFVTSGSTFATKPKTSIVTKQNFNSGLPATTYTTKFQYYNTGAIQYQIQCFGITNKEVKTEYGNYNNVGLAQSITISAASLPLKTGSFEYDATGRFVLKSTNAMGMTSSSTYDIFGNVLTETGADGITISHEYDSFNRLFKTTTPDGNNYQYLAWTNGVVPGSLYKKFIQKDGFPTSVIYYDALSREIKATTQGFNYVTITQDKEYNVDGTLSKVSSPYYPNETKVYSVFEYNDVLKRTTKSQFGGLSTSFTYAEKTTKIINPEGKTSVAVTNALGKPVSNKDFQGNTINYTYDNLWQPLSSGTNVLTYDDNTNVTTLTDPNTGTVTSTYDAYGRIVSQKDASGVTSIMTYDPLDRITSITRPGDVTIYTYVTSGNGIGQILSVKNNNTGNQQNYTYNNLGRVISMKELSEGQLFETKYDYDAYGNNTTIIYPTGLNITNVYGQGMLLEVWKNTQLVWKITKQDATNYQYRFGDTKNSTVSLSFDATFKNLQNISAKTDATVFNFDYQIEPTTGNLLKRTDNINSLREDFSYDMDRLHEIKQNGVVVNTINYQVNGNITDKTDVGGVYAYDSKRVNALNTITPPNPNALTQTIVYNAFNKPTAITESASNYDFKYGPDQERVKMTYTNTADNTKNFIRYYAANFEKEVKGNISKEIHYIAGENGTVAAFITTNGNIGTGKMYYMVNDHLGSIVQLIDQTGAVSEMSFDAWGRRRNPKNWRYTGFDTPSILSRGYTGHEHLDAVSLINMNARLYEPLTGRMLSPDNYIQAPDNLQSYNRYSYVMNNPLKYTDPSGNIWGLVIGMIIGAEAGGAAANHGELNPFKWTNPNTGYYVAGGAILGGVIGDYVEFAMGGNAVFFGGPSVPIKTPRYNFEDKFAGGPVANSGGGGNSVGGASAGSAGNAGIDISVGGSGNGGVTYFENRAGSLLGDGGNSSEGVLTAGGGDVNSVTTDIWYRTMNYFSKVGTASGKKFMLPIDFTLAAYDFSTNYYDMRDANWKNSDKYFHAKANFQATHRGPGGQFFAVHFSNLREIWDQNIKKYPRFDSELDQKANLFGRTQANFFSQSNYKNALKIYRPFNLPTKY